MRRSLHIDIIKIVAIFGVVFNHTGNYGFTLYTISTDSPFYWLYLFLSIICKAAVPLFFMCSGALLVGKEETLKKLFVHRVARFLFVLLVVPLLVYLFLIRRDISSFDIGYYFRTLYSREIVGAHWFLYSYMSALLLLPFIRPIAKSMDGSKIIYLFSLNIMFAGIIPTVLDLCGLPPINTNFSLPFATAWNLFYMVIGYCADYKIDISRISKKHIVYGVILSLCAIAMTMIAINIKFGIAGKYTGPQIHNSLIAIPTVSFYISVKYILNRRPLSEKAASVIRYLSGLTFGVYLLEEIGRGYSYDFMRSLIPTIHTLPASMVWAICVVVGCGTVVAFLKKLPLFSKIL